MALITLRTFLPHEPLVDVIPLSVAALLSTITIKMRIKRLLPFEKAAIEIQKIEGGFSNNIFRVNATSASYVFHSPKIAHPKEHFAHIFLAAKIAYKAGIGLQVIAEDLENQDMLLPFVAESPWPSFEEAAAPFRDSMQSLRQFHECMPLLPQTERRYSPFHFISAEERNLQNVNLPHHFHVAVERIKRILDSLTPWLERHAKLCHGDFHKGNALLEKKETGYKVHLIDFDSLANGHPFFDIAKFTLNLPRERRIELLSAYLEKDHPSPGELAHFELLDLALLMVVTVVRFKSAISAMNAGQPSLGKEELEKILDSSEPLPSFLSVTFKDTSCQARQKGALYALSEFLKRTEEPAFSTLLNTV